MDETGLSARFETERLSARLPVPGDAPVITAYFQDQDISKMLARAPWPYALEDAQGWIEAAMLSAQQGGEFAFVLHHAEHGLIGSTGMMHVTADVWEIGFWLGKPFWGQGYITEAARGLMDWAARELGVTRFVSGHIVDNPASGAVLRKLGFVHAGKLIMYVSGRDCEVESDRYTHGDVAAEVALGKPSYD